MTLLVWVCLGFLIVATAGPLAYAAAAGWRAFRAFRASSRRLADGLATVQAAGEATEERVGRLAAGDGGPERLTHAAERLQRSLAELAAIGRAAAEARAALAVVRGSVPRK